MNVIFALLFTAALGFAAATGNMKGFTDGLFGGVKGAVDIAIGLTGVLALWLGMVKILEKAGAVDALARVIGPVMRWIFPGLPKDHPALAAMTPDERARFDAALEEEEERLRLAEIVYKVRAEAGLTQAALAKRIGTQQSVISAIENGSQMPTITTLRRIARATHRRLSIELADAS